ncbi:type II toxin-antitoxin system Phd/YefM family antitoxin [Nodosilinea sp. LEGE 07298]|uniref:type II toxin-antitoxin system Phd/YefM family antitoxin n=1 Tax=Nodosilinea sp. LEGE 07298 TaxID=2777970 RepID=UPI0018822758|nr:type II toxin-antitoxin system Phd/YefM family antitoxin [Nodosilinea sp. LEGE 07298]MBE9109308.1 type II toxin-antitoxin system Phd/YefM family antitoxin [Nodosilinea sp. LEGE 07298]
MFNLLDIHSLTDFQRNTRKFLERLRDSHQPMVLTVNGKAAVVMQDAESYQALLDELAQARAASQGEMNGARQLSIVAE